MAQALGKAPCFYTADLIPQVEAALAAEADERDRHVLLAIDESHLLDRRPARGRQDADKS